MPLPNKDDPVVNKVNSFIIESNINVIKAVPKKGTALPQIRGPSDRLRLESSNDSKVDNPFSHSVSWKPPDQVRNYQIRKSNEPEDRISSLTRKDEPQIFKPIKNQNFSYFEDLDSSSQLKHDKQQPSSFDPMGSTNRKMKKGRPIMAATF
mmetsp:Transcript_31443/g.48093  ORF Transcript_31443/g.48093 Transcript_31443/m.48093 type:complete len:151 (-) Transcript_31443:389-841(-)